MFRANYLKISVDPASLPVVNQFDKQGARLNVLKTRTPDLL